jgi:hypothetical protein
MKKLLTVVFTVLSISLSGQWVRPNQFTELTTVTDSTFEVYSQRFGLPRKASLTTIKKFMDQSLTISGDSVCITKATGTTCVKLPSQALNQTSQSWANSVVSQSYSIPADTVAKYDYLFVQYETNIAPSGSTITLPSPSAATSGKIIDVLVYLGPSATIQSATLSGSFATISGNTHAYPNSISAIAGHYRFVSTVAVSGGGYKWQLISSPASPTAAAASSKRVNSRVINSQNVVFTDTTFQNTDEFTIYAEAETGNTSLRIPVPDSSYAGKVIYYYPQKRLSYTNTITCDDVRILEFSQTTPFGTSSGANEIITVPKKLTGVLYEGTYYWEMRNLYNDAVSTTDADVWHKSYTVNDTLSIDTILAYDELHLEILTVSGGVGVVIPQPTAATKGKTLWFYPIAPSNTALIVSFGGNYIGRYDSVAALTTTNSLAIKKPIKLVSNGTNWMWHPPVHERIAQNKLVGRFSASTGQAEEISISSDFTMSGGTLALASAGSGYNFYTTTFAGGGRIIVAYQGGVPSASGSAGNYTLSIPANCRPISFSFSGAAADLTVGGAFNITCAWTSLPSSINTSVATAFLPSITITETTTASRIQLNNQGTGYQITHPTIGTGSTTTTITGVNGIGNYIIKGVF